MALKSMRAMFIAQGASGLAEDKVVNNFHFRSETESGNLEADDFTEVRAAVTGFYQLTAAQTPMSAQLQPISGYLSPWLGDSAELRLYDMNQDDPRVPITSTIGLGSRLSLTGFPEECAVCLSYRTDLPNTGRRRGRVYIGPLALAATVVHNGNASGPARVAPEFAADLIKAANRMSAMSVNMRWVTLSKFDSDSTVHPVKVAWVDDAVDIQRRRGPGNGSRVTADLAQPA